MDLYEVTVGRFRKFVDAGKGTKAAPPANGSGALPTVAGSGWHSTWDNRLWPNTAALKAGLKCDPNTNLHTWTDNPGGNESRPINCVSWHTAFAFCIWDGGRLATNAEWQYAATGGSEQREYPWSSPPSSRDIGCSRASFGCGAFGTLWDACGDGTAGCATTDFIVVGTKPGGNGRWGQADLSGNVREWVRDSTGPTPVPCNDCVFLEIPVGYANIQTKMARGGQYSSTPAPPGGINPLANNGAAFDSPEVQGNMASGIRCVRTP